MSEHYRFGKKTGIEQPQEVGSSVPDPKDGYGLNIKFANTAFGQGMANTPIQMGAALSSVVNGGTYYRPRLVDRTVSADGTETVVKPEVLGSNVVKAETSKTIVEFMQSVVSRNYLVYGMKEVRPGYKIGGKTGTAQIANPAGGYYEDKFNGMFTGFIGGDKIQYVVVIRVNEPKIAGYAGSRAAGPIFADVSDMLINNFNVLPKSR
jgi:cell division protein FtsI/penicillin-binding protein 2